MGNRRRSFRFEDWPNQDQIAWNRAIATGSLLDEQGPAAHWAPATKGTAVSAYGYWLRFLTQSTITGIGPKPITRIHVAEYIERIGRTVKPTTIAIYVEHLYHAARVMFPLEDWTWLRALVTHLQNKARKNFCRYPSPVDSKTLFELGIRMMREVNDQGDWRKEAFVKYRDGLIIALLAARPIRRRTLALIEIGKQLRCISGKWHLVFKSHEVKNRRPIEFALPEILNAFMDRYLDWYRPKAGVAPDKQALWVSYKTGSALSGESIATGVKRNTLKHLGQAINLHQFRHCAATTISRRNPDHVLTIAPLLGHATLDMAYRHYVVSKGHESSKLHQSLISDLRRGVFTRSDV